MLVIAWVLGVAVTRRPSSTASTRRSATRRSWAPSTRRCPAASDRLLSAFNAVVGSSDFPRYLEPFDPEHITPVPAPNQRAWCTCAGVARAGGQRGQDRRRRPVLQRDPRGQRLRLRAAPGDDERPRRRRCRASDRAPRRHRPRRPRSSTTTRDSTSPYWPFPTWTRPPCSSRDPPNRAGSAAVLGYPEDGPYDAEPGRIRSQQRLHSPNIYGDGTVTRDTYAVYARVRQGNSGGPLVSPQRTGPRRRVRCVADRRQHGLRAHLEPGLRRRPTAGIGSDRSVATGGCAL